MTQKIPLLFGVHAHQPVGNFPEVVDDAVVRCYQPFLETLYRFPDFAFAFHSSGWLLDYLGRHHAPVMHLLQEMVARGQVELVGAGDTEPVLASIPHQDRLGQLKAMKERLERNFGQCPQGAWLTERVWDPSSVPALVESGIRYVVVDDYHFLCAGLETADLGHFYRTEESGQPIDVFPISEALRYRLPFSEVAEAVAYIASIGQGSQHGIAAIYFDDIEKFGLWPDTYDWVYSQGWLEQFLAAILHSDTVVPMHFARYREMHQPRGIVYLPTVSYREMNAWTLPPDLAREYGGFLHQEQEAGRLERRKALIRGGTWKSFLARYPESNWMHKRMLQLSARFHTLPKHRQTQEMREMLYAAQSNDAYWHGLFGGIYLPHLRRAIFHAITRLEGLLDKVQKRSPLARLDVDLDGAEEWFYHDRVAQAVVRPSPHAAMVEWNHYPLAHNFGDVLARRDEAYHDRIRERQIPTVHDGAGIASAHDRISYRNAITEEDLVFDDLPCHSFLDHLGEELLSYQVREEADPPVFCAASTAGWRVEKSFGLRKGVLSVAYLCRPGPAEGGNTVLRTRLYLSMPSCDGPGGQLWVDGSQIGGFGQEAGTASGTDFLLKDSVLGGAVLWHLGFPASWRCWPHRTVSQSEAGFEKIMQGWVLELEWTLSCGQELQIGLTGRIMADHG